MFPRFNQNSFWSFKDACDVWGAKCPAPPLGLITLAALLPAHWDLRLVDRNAEALTDEHVGWADLVLTGGMMPQQADTLELLALFKARGVPVCVGGPGVTSNPRIYEDADFVFVGEAEGTIGQFVEAWEGGATSGRFEAPKFQADVTASPIPRFDLLTFKNYLYVGVQFSRGCPFTCEFCDIIELYGRVPRTKTSGQMLAELDALYAMGYRGHVDFVDDNLIGNKKAIKLFLPHLKEWQVRHGYPFMFSTEASINLSDDKELLAMMRAANFFVVFVGIESPDEATLISTQKKQNARRSLEESVNRIYAAGIFVTAGFIVGFDTEKGSMSRAMADCVAATNIPISMVGLLMALPNTQLMRRLDREGRLYSGFDVVDPNVGDQCTAGLNFRTLRERRAVLADYRDVLQEIYEPAAFFARVRRLALLLKRPKQREKITLPLVGTWMKLLGRIFWRMTVQQPRLARHFWPALVFCARHNLAGLQSLLSNMVMYLHLYPFSRHVIRQLDAQIATIDAGRWVEPALRDAAPAPAPPVRAVRPQAAAAAAA